jgi:uncharacterized membrane protein YkvA (DUF1232 family)
MIDSTLHKLNYRYDTEEEFERDRHNVEDNLIQKLAAVGQKISFAKDIVAMFRYMIDKKVSWQRKAVVVVALLYFIAPLDTIPDLVPLVGYFDDLGVIAAVVKFMGRELTPYYEAELRAS